MLANKAAAASSEVLRNAITNVRSFQGSRSLELLLGSMTETAPWYCLIPKQATDHDRGAGRKSTARDCKLCHFCFSTMPPAIHLQGQECQALRAKRASGAEKELDDVFTNHVTHVLSTPR